MVKKKLLEARTGKNVELNFLAVGFGSYAARVMFFR
jgi:hypothetical protein